MTCKGIGNRYTAQKTDLVITENNFRESQQEFTWDMPRHINSIVLNYNEDAKFDVEGTSVFIGDTEVGQVDAQDGKFTYIFGGMEGKHSSVRIIGDLLSLASVEVYGE